MSIKRQNHFKRENRLIKIYIIVFNVIVVFELVKGLVAAIFILLSDLNYDSLTFKSFKISGIVEFSIITIMIVGSTITLA